MASQNDEHGCAYVDGIYQPLGQASIPITEWGFIRGDCVYDAIPFSDGRLFRLRDHLDRFWESMAKWRLESPLNKERVHQVCHGCVGKSGLRDGLLMIITTRGIPPSLTIRNPALFENRFYAFAQVLPPIATPEVLAKGLSIVVSRVPRIPERSIDSTAKNFQWGDFVQARLEAHDAGADNALLLDYDGNLAEGPGFNVFALEGQRLSTPSHNCLKGMTRRTVIEIGESMGLEVVERNIPEAELEVADEVFFSSSAGGIFPVAKIDGRPVSGGEAGPTTKAIMDEYWRRRRHPDFSESVEYD